MKRTSFKPSGDGVDHLNVYSQGKTSLGRFLSNFAFAPIETIDGHFDSIEGYWYWLSAEETPLRDKLRYLSGAEAKEYGRYLKASDWPKDSLFEKKITEAIKVKLSSNPGRLEDLTELRVPLAHYYVYGDKVVRVSGSDWILQFLSTFIKSGSKID